MKRTTFSGIVLLLVCGSANAAGYYIRLDVPTPSAFVEFDGVTAKRLDHYEQNYFEGSYVGETEQIGEVDLSTGKLLAFNDSNNGSGGAATFVYFGDTLTFDLAGQPYADVEVNMALHGTFEPSLDNGSVQYGLRLGQVLLQGAFQAEDRVRFKEDGTLVDDLLSFVVRVGPEDLDFAFWSYIGLTSGGFGVADFRNTAQMSIVAPDGVTFTSASGVFLAEVVPIPPAVLLFGSALGLMGVMRRKISS